MTKYDKILKLFIDIESPECLTEPRPHGNYIYATDTYACIRIKRELCEEAYEAHEQQPKSFDRIFPKPECSLVLNVAEVASAISKVPEEECVKVYGKDAECDECRGKGKVTWIYESKVTDEDYEHEFDCPVCDGSGKVNHKHLTREQRSISFNGVHFNIGILMNVLNAIHHLGHKIATVQRLNEQQSMLINVEQGVDIVFMSNLSEASVCEIKLKSSEE